MPDHHLPILPILLFLIISAIVFWKINPLNASQTLGEQITQAVSSPPAGGPTLIPSPAFSPTPTPSALPIKISSSPTPAVASSPSPKPIPSPSPVSSDKNNINNFIYPNSSTKTKSDKSAELESSDSSENITSWYKDKIRALGFNAKSFVSSKTNGVVLNKLEGDDGKTEVKVEITQDPGSKVVIKISLNW